MGDSGQQNTSKMKPDRAGCTPPSKQIAWGLLVTEVPITAIGKQLKEEAGREHPTQEPWQVEAKNGRGSSCRHNHWGLACSWEGTQGTWRSGSMLL